MKIKLIHKFEDIVSVDNLLLAWQEFIRGKRNKKDVQSFSFNLMDNILSLHYDLKNSKYKHGGYECFKMNDPKPRIIHKASVRDRLLHHAVYRILYPFFDKTFISDSFSCRNNKGTHKAINRFREYAYIVSKNNTKTCWVLKCDIRKFFASVRRDILINILKEHILDEDIINLLKEIILSFEPNGLPLGNLTSQLFANVYMDEFDQFIKRDIKVSYYIRYADDFVILSENESYLKDMIKPISKFLNNELKLILHPKKIFIETISSGIDFLGWKHFFGHRILRKTTKLRMLKNIEKGSGNCETLSSCFGLLKHGNTYKIKENILKAVCRQNIDKMLYL
ncbi:MAG: reverse transcriptase/maturase family protein [Candidatus Nealsonbacteria bacterium]|nr:reverse transcriptase/maturase family protein [Candidatus Nealsonbacteria bacterium]